MQPLRDCVLLEEVEINHSSPGSKIKLILSKGGSDDGEHDGMTAGIAIKVGPGVWDASGLQFIEPANSIEIGKPYLLNKIGNYRYQIGLKKYLLCRLSNIHARLDPEEVIMSQGDK
jgi:hypothetical protein